jgi:hypothetical protein
MLLMAVNDLSTAQRSPQRSKHDRIEVLTPNTVSTSEDLYLQLSRP